MSVGDISPRPLEEDENTISELDDKEQVNKEPAQPGKKSTQFDHLKIGDRFVSTDSGHATLVPILERFRRATHSQGYYIPGRMFSRLHGKWGNTWQRSSTLVRKISHVANGKNFGMAWYAEVFIHDAPALAVSFSQLLGQRRSRVPGGPDYCAGADKFVFELNAFHGNSKHQRVKQTRCRRSRPADGRVPPPKASGAPLPGVAAVKDSVAVCE